MCKPNTHLTLTVHTQRAGVYVHVIVPCLSTASTCQQLFLPKLHITHFTAESLSIADDTADQHKHFSSVSSSINTWGRGRTFIVKGRLVFF